MAIRHMAQRRFDNGFGLGPRHKRFGREPKGQAPELPPTDDARDRFAPEPARGPLPKSLGAGFPDGRLRPDGQRSGVEPKCLREENAGVKGRAVEAGVGKGAAEEGQSVGAGMLTFQRKRVSAKHRAQGCAHFGYGSLLSRSLKSTHIPSQEDVPGLPERSTASEEPFMRPPPPAAPLGAPSRARR